MNPFKYYQKSDVRVDSQGIISLLPTELLDLILSYLTNEFQGIIRFSTICKEWKEIADSSRLWLTCQLSFYCSDRFILCAYSWETTPTIEDLRREKARTRHVRKLYLFDEQILFSPQDIKLDVERTRAGKTISPMKTPEYLESILHQQLTEPNVEEAQEIFFKSLPPNHQIFETRQRFMKIFTRFHLLCKWYAPKIFWLNKWRTCLSNLSQKIVKIGLISSAALLVPAMYLFSDISATSGLTIKNHIGFALTYLFIVQYWIALMLSIPDQIYNQSFLMRVDMAAPILWIHFIGLVIFPLGIILSIGLFHYALSEDAYGFQYSYATIPLWIILIACLLFTMGMICVDDRRRSVADDDSRTAKIALCLGTPILLGIPLGFTLLGINFDSSNHDSLISIDTALICWYPFEIALFSLFVLSLGKAVNEIRGMLIAHFLSYYFTDFVFRTGIELLRTIFIAGMLASMIYFTVAATSDENSDSLLSQGLISLIFWLLSCTYTWYGLVLDQLWQS